MEQERISWRGPPEETSGAAGAELHLLDSGHFALDDKGDQIMPLLRDFLGRHLHA